VTGIKIKKGTITGTNINLAKLGTVPSATTAGIANALGALEPTRRSLGSAGILGRSQQFAASRSELPQATDDAGDWGGRT